MDLAEARERGFADAVRHPWETARVQVVRKLITRGVPLAHDATVLDVGCGDTFVAEQLAADRRAARFYAVDTAFSDGLIAQCVARLQKAGVTNVMPFPSLEAVTPRLDREVSLVLLMDVIEHIEDDRGFLKALVSRPWIGAGTRFLLTVPAYQSLFCSHDVFLGHYRRYTGRMLREHVSDAGLEVIDAGYFFASLLPLRWLQVLKERIAGTVPGRATTGLVTWSGGRTKAALLERMLVLDADLSLGLRRIGLTLPGLSTYAICRPSA